ncbi:MAG: ATP-binding protein [Firmicutes bacterium]|nr:ATP-binding protein [Bacillota bacterium]
MKKVIIITGHLAALKSTVSTKLGNDLGIIVFNKDDLKEVLGKTIGFKTRADNLKLSLATFKLMVKLMKDTLKVNECVILESNFRLKEFVQISEMCRRLGYDKTVIFMSGDPQVLYQRYKKRQPYRDKVHTSTGLLDFDTFKSVLVVFDKQYYGEDAIYLDTSTFEESDYQSLLHKVIDRLDGK